MIPPIKLMRTYTYYMNNIKYFSVKLYYNTVALCKSELT